MCIVKINKVKGFLFTQKIQHNVKTRLLVVAQDKTNDTSDERDRLFKNFFTWTKLKADFYHFLAQLFSSIVSHDERKGGDLLCYPLCLKMRIVAGLSL
jgi:hypothetical protein